MTVEDEVKRKLASRGDYDAMTQEDLDEWNRQRVANLRKLRPGHWTHRAKRHRRLVEHTLKLRRLVRKYRAQTEELIEEVDRLRKSLAK